MDSQLNSLDNDFHVTNDPTMAQLNQIEKWLIAEQNKSGEGFYCNWNVVQSAFQKKEMMTISHKKRTVGFVIWSISDKIAKIDIAEIKPNYRKKGAGRQLIEGLFTLFTTNNILVVDLQCAPPSSEGFWRNLGFSDFPDSSPRKNEIHRRQNVMLYKVLKAHHPTSNTLETNETIELWNDEPFKFKIGDPPSHIWNLEFAEGTRKTDQPNCTSSKI